MAGDYGTRTAGQLGWLMLAGLLVVTMLFGGSLLAWRGLTAARGAPATSPAPAPDGPVAFGAPELVDGVPWGFGLTPDGAVAAAVTAVTVTGQPQVVFDGDRFATVAAVVFTAEEAASQARQVDAARVQFEVSGWADQPPSRRMYHFTPLAVRLETFDASRPAAVADVWAMTVIGVGDAGGAVFTTSTVQLEAVDGTWAVSGLDSVEGPTPVVDAAPTAPGRTRALVRDAWPTLPLPLEVGP